jgi:thiol-disulfide isomerase/thioredoxin
MRIMTKRTWVLLGILVTLGAIGVLGPSVHGGVGMPAPDIASRTWLNSEPKRMVDLRGKVVLVEFWTFGCFNCRNVEPYVKEWHQKYADQGLVVIGVHAPEFDYERDIENVKQHIRKNDIRYAVPIDNDFTTWNRYGNRYWPAMYLIDKQGIIRYTRFGEGGYVQTEQSIRTLLAER